jgi:TM2 domain-containing membrane protein YozV
MHVACPHCHSTVQVDDQLAGQTSRCPLCSGEFRVPAAGVGMPPPPPPPGFASASSNVPRAPVSSITVARLALGVVALSVGSFGIHKFILGRNVEGLIMLLVTLLSCFFVWPIIWVIAIVEGIIYLIKTDREFEQEYLIGTKGWF